MLIAIIHSCESSTAHTPLRHHSSYMEGDYTRNQIQMYVDDFKSRFVAKRFSVLKVMLMELNVEEGTIEVVENLSLKNELPKRTVINPSKKAYKGMSQKVNPGDIVGVGTFPNGLFATMAITPLAD